MKLCPTLVLFALFLLAAPVQANDDDLPTLDGSWQGVIAIAGQELPVVFEISDDGLGDWKGHMLSPSQTDQQIPLTSVSFHDREVTILVEYVGGSYRGKLAASGRSIRGDWKQGALEVSLDLDRHEKPFAYERPQTPKAPFPYPVEKVKFPNSLAKLSLAGTLSLPKDRVSPAPAVVLVSGSGPQDRDETIAGHKPFAVIADYLARRGVAVLRYDDRGVGESEGTFEFGTTLDFATDAWAAVEFLKSRPEIDPEKIGLIGHSEGGLIAPIVSTKREGIAFLVLLAAPCLPGDQTLLSQSKAVGEASGLSSEMLALNQQFSQAVFDLMTQPNPDLEKVRDLGARFEKEAKELSADDAKALENLGPILQQQLSMLESPWFMNFLNLDPAEYFRKVTCPVLALNGELDLQVLADLHLPAIEAAVPKGLVTTRRLSGLNHLFQKAETGLPAEYATIEETISPGVLTNIGDWILGF